HGEYAFQQRVGERRVRPRAKRLLQRVTTRTLGPLQVKPATTVEEARRLIDAFKGRPEDFELPISNELLDPVGINMAIITDAILAREWEPNGYAEGDGFRVYKYKAME